MYPDPMYPDPIYPHHVSMERGVYCGDILELVEFSRKHGFALRFIEFMDVETPTATRYPLHEVGRDQGTAPSVDYEFVDGQGDIGVIASVTEPFCTSCTRVRLTADGKLVTCLFSETWHDLKSLLRNGAMDEDLSQFVSAVWRNRKDRYSDERLEALHSIQGYESKDHKNIEMISLRG